MFFNDVTYVVGVAFSDIFNVEVVNGETKKDGSPFMVPEAGSGFSLVVYGYIEAFSKDMV